MDLATWIAVVAGFLIVMIFPPPTITRRRSAEDPGEPQPEHPHPPEGLS